MSRISISIWWTLCETGLNHINLFVYLMEPTHRIESMRRERGCSHSVAGTGAAALFEPFHPVFVQAVSNCSGKTNWTPCERLLSAVDHGCLDQLFVFHCETDEKSKTQFCSLSHSGCTKVYSFLGKVKSQWIWLKCSMSALRCVSSGRTTESVFFNVTSAAE